MKEGHTGWVVKVVPDDFDQLRRVYLYPAQDIQHESLGFRTGFSSGCDPTPARRRPTHGTGVMIGVHLLEYPLSARTFKKGYHPGTVGLRHPNQELTEHV